MADFQVPGTAYRPSREFSNLSPKLPELVNLESNEMPDPLFHLLSAAPAPVAPFSHAVESNGWIFLTGQMPTDPDDDSKRLPEGVDAQTRRVMDNLIIVLNELGLGVEHVIQARAYLTHFEEDYDAMNRAYASYFPADRRPARSCIGVTRLARGARVEIDMLARRPGAT